MNILLYDKEINYDEILSNGYKSASLIEIFKESHVIMITISSNEETKNLINKNILSHSLKKPIIVNTSRGDVVNEDDIIDFLENGLLSNYSTDVLTNEENIDFLKKSRLFKYAKTHNNVLITPHIAGCNLDSWEKTDNFIVDKIIKILQINV
jgi:D-3-phosphoglycerate dehydrogenase